MWRLQARQISSSPLRSLRSRAIHASRTYREDGEYYNPRAVERVEDETDVCIVGAGPAGLSAAIRIKQLERERGKEVRVVVLEKGSEVGEWLYSPYTLTCARLIVERRCTYPLWSMSGAARST